MQRCDEVGGGGGSGRLLLRASSCVAVVGLGLVLFVMCGRSGGIIFVMLHESQKYRMDICDI